MKVVDSHQHFWKFDPVRDAWMEPGKMEAIRKDFLPADLKPIIDQYNVDATVAVQADQSLNETDFLLEQANKNDFVAGVVGWIDLKSSSLQSSLESYQDSASLVGFRHITQSEPKGFMTDPTFIEGVTTILEEDYRYDVLIFWHQMEEAIEMIQALPEKLMVLDHIAKPNIQDGRILKWKKSMKELAEFEHLYCKISGMITEAHWQYWTENDLRPYIDVAMETFGPDRCMFGSDWPVCTLAGSYGQVISTLRSYLSSFTKSEQSRIMGQNCLDFYGLTI